MLHFFRRKRKRTNIRTSSRVDEAIIVWNIALKDAFAMGQLPGFVHLAGACLYRLKDADQKAAEDIGITVNEIRRWAVEHLPAKDPSRNRYEGDVDFEYRVGLSGNMLTVRPVRKPVNAIISIYPDHVHPPGEGGVVHKTDTAASKLQTAAMESLFRFVEPIHADAENIGSSTAIIRRILLALLATTEVQSCLEDVGYSVDELRRKLGELG